MLMLCEMKSPFFCLLVPDTQMNHPCRSSATPTASTAAWVKPLRPWGAAKGATTTAPFPWSMASSRHKISFTTSAPAAHTAFLSRPARFRHYPDTHLLSLVWSILTPAFLSWARVAARGWPRLWGSPWGQLMAPARTSLQAAVEDTQIFLLAPPPGWMKWTTGSFDLTISMKWTTLGIFCVFCWILRTGQWLCKGLDICSLDLTIIS